MESPPVDSNPTLLVLHAVRLLGMADDVQVARRFDLTANDARELLLDFQATGWVTRVEFGDLRGWTLTEVGKAENERQLASEVTSTHARDVVRTTYRDFTVHNARLLRASTDWQIRPNAADPLAPNNHADHRWDSRIVHELADLAAYLSQACRTLTDRLVRFGGYDRRYSSALARVERGEHAWVNEPRADSCHTVWMELHEDLLATLNVQRGHELN